MFFSRWLLHASHVPVHHIIAGWQRLLVCCAIVVA